MVALKEAMVFLFQNNAASLPVLLEQNLDEDT